MAENTQISDSRHQRRITLMQALFAYDVADTTRDMDQRTLAIQQWQMLHQDTTDVIAQLPEIDAQIVRLAPERPLHDVNKVDLAILRTIVFEWRTSATPKKVLIDEAVELAKEFGSESSHRFVNGVLAQLYSISRTEGSDHT